MKHKFQYETKTTTAGNVYRYRTWWELFEDQDTGKYVRIKRRMAIKINGERVYWIAGPVKK